MSLSFALKARRPLTAVHSFLVNQQRWNTREAIHRYVEPNKFKKHMLAASEPYFKRKYILPEEACKGHKPQEVEMSPLNKILVKELVEDLKQSEIILFVQYNYTPFQSERVYKNTIIKSGGKFQDLSNPVYKEAFRILKMEQLDNLFIGRNALITGQLDCLPRCVNALKKMPQFILMAGSIENHIYEYDQLKLISASASLDETRAKLLHTLRTPSSELYSYLEQHQSNIQQSDNVDNSESNKT